MTAFRFSPSVPGEAYEYYVGTERIARIGRVLKEEARTYPYHPTGRWIATDGYIRHGGFPTRIAAAEWLLTFIPRTQQ
jgi:hypothetical protein